MATSELGKRQERQEEIDGLQEDYREKPTYSKLETLLTKISEINTEDERYMKLFPDFKPFKWSEKENNKLNEYKTQLDTWLGDNDWRDKSKVPNIFEVEKKHERAADLLQDKKEEEQNESHTPIGDTQASFNMLKTKQLKEDPMTIKVESLLFHQKSKVKELLYMKDCTPSIFLK